MVEEQEEQKEREEEDPTYRNKSSVCIEKYWKGRPG